MEMAYDNKVNRIKVNLLEHKVVDGGSSTVHQKICFSGLAKEAGMEFLHFPKCISISYDFNIEHKSEFENERYLLNPIYSTMRKIS